MAIYLCTCVCKKHEYTWPRCLHLQSWNNEEKGNTEQRRNEETRSDVFTARTFTMCRHNKSCILLRSATRMTFWVVKFDRLRLYREVVWIKIDVVLVYNYVYIASAWRKEKPQIVLCAISFLHTERLTTSLIKQQLTDTIHYGCVPKSRQLTTWPLMFFITERHVDDSHEVLLHNLAIL